jgi:hypothetical protein
MELKPRKLGKKAISEVVADIMALFLVAIITIIFAIIYKLGAEARAEVMDSSKGVTYGNYLAQAYLRTPLAAGETKLTMAELIALYDHNQTLEHQLEIESDREDNQMFKDIKKITEQFAERNLNKDKCFIIAIKGNHFDPEDVAIVGGICDIVNFRPEEIFEILEKYKIPKDSYITYVPQIDPRYRPVEIYFINDAESLARAFSQEAHDELRKEFSRVFR